MRHADPQVLTIPRLITETITRGDAGATPADAVRHGALLLDTHLTGTPEHGHPGPVVRYVQTLVDHIEATPSPGQGQPSPAAARATTADPFGFPATVAESPCAN